MSDAVSIPAGSADLVSVPRVKAPPRLASEKTYFNRELSWLQFNTRVLEEAQNPEVPLLERIRFLSISASNLDEFYMVRVAGLRTQELAGMTDASFDGHTPARQLEKIAKRVARLTKAQDKSWLTLRKSLKSQGIHVKSLEELSGDEQAKMRDIYEAKHFAASVAADN